MKKAMLIAFMVLFFSICGFPGEEKKDKKNSTGTKKETTHGTFCITKKELQSLPNGRNTWSILNLVPGILQDREDVGGFFSGKQSNFYGFGTLSSDTGWTVDGAYLTDQQTLGASLAYWNTNAYEEIQVITGNQDISLPSGGITLNFVSRRGSNDFHGDIYIYGENESWEMTQAIPSYFISKGWGIPGISRLYQYGINFGGPVLHDHIWFYAAYGIQDIQTRTITQEEDSTWLGNGYLRLDFKSAHTSGSLSFARDEKNIWNRYWLSDVYQAPETAWRQTGPHMVYQAHLEQRWGDLVLNAKAHYQDSGFKQDPQANRLNNNYIPGHRPGPDWITSFFPSTYWTGSCKYFSTDRDSFSFSLDGNYSRENFFAGDHEIRFGVQYFSAGTTSQSLFPNQRRLIVYQQGNPNSYKEIQWLPDREYSVKVQGLSFYLGDTFTTGSFTLSAGCRYDRQDSTHQPVTIPALTFDGIPIFTKYLGECTLPSRDQEATWEVFSPRINLAYDIAGDGGNVFTASFARYGSHLGNSLADFTWPSWNREIDVEWNDKNGNMMLEWGEWSEDIKDWISWAGFNPLNPYGLPATNELDSNYKSPLLTEMTLAFEKRLGKDIRISLQAIYKKLSRLTWDRGYFAADYSNPVVSYHPGDLETADNWYEAGKYVFTDGSSKPYYERYFIPSLLYRTNYGSGTYRTYKALQLVISKDFSAGWMFDASFVFSGWKSYFDEAEYFDRTNFGYFDGAAYGLTITQPDSEATGMIMNSRWQVKISGLVELPFGFTLSGIFRAREGYIIPYHEYVYRNGGLGWSIIYKADEEMGDNRLPALWVLDLGLEKTFQVGTNLSVTFLVNGYNVTNNAITLNVEPLLLSLNRGQPLGILHPGIFQFGVRVTF